MRTVKTLSCLCISLLVVSSGVFSSTLTEEGKLVLRDTNVFDANIQGEFSRTQALLWFSCPSRIKLINSQQQLRMSAVQVRRSRNHSTLPLSSGGILVLQMICSRLSFGPGVFLTKSITMNSASTLQRVWALTQLVLIAKLAEQTLVPAPVSTLANAYVTFLSSHFRQIGADICKIRLTVQRRMNCS